MAAAGAGGRLEGQLMVDMKNPIRILTVDDHPVLREGIASIIACEPDLTLVAEASNGHEAIEIFRRERPDVTLMDLQMPELNGIDAIAAIRSEFPKARIIVLTTYRGDMQAVRAFKAGASGYLLKSMLRKDLIETIHAVHLGQRRVPSEIASEIAEHHTDDALTDREVEVLRQVASGQANKIVAVQLDITEETVKAHMRNILAKLGANDRTHAVTIALKRGIIDL
jgi:DNA-binding NarL/FixJ family response regulator